MNVICHGSFEMKIYSFFKQSALAETPYPWQLTYEDAVKKIWKNPEEIQKTPGVKILSSIVENILELSCHNRNYFKLNEKLFLEIIVTEIFKKFNSFETYKEFVTEKGDDANEIKKKIIKIENILLALLFNIKLFNHFIQKTNADPKALIEMPNLTSFVCFDISKVNKALTQSEAYLVAVQKFLTNIEDNYCTTQSEMIAAKKSLDNNPFLKGYKGEFEFIMTDVADFAATYIA